MASKKGIPKRDGTGHGKRDNKGRGGCPPSKQKDTGKTPSRKQK